MKPTRLETVAPLLGRDLALDYAQHGGYFEDADLSAPRGNTSQGGRLDARRDLVVTEGLDNLTQALANRLKTRRGELAPLGHPTYGSRHHELLGEPNVPRTWNLVKLYVLQALREEPRIEKVLQATVGPEHQPPRSSVRIELKVRLVGFATAVNLVVPFSLEAAP
jgi:phage baseplate assembly protein W